MTDQTQFQNARMNFFPGFFTTAEDWKTEQNYHLAKRKQHDRLFHNTHGTVRGEGDELEVHAADGLSVLVSTGAALDGHGREILLLEPTLVSLEAKIPELVTRTSSRTVYIVIRYDEQECERLENVEQPQYSGNTRIKEDPVITARLEEPDNRTWLELARIQLEVDVTQIVDAEDPGNPKPNEIDRTHVKWSVSVSELNEKLIAESVNSEALEQRISEEESKTVDLSDRLSQEESKSEEFLSRLSQEEELSVTMQAELARLDQLVMLHNRGLHTPGIMTGEGQGLRVQSAGGFDVNVLIGAALDAAGNSLRLEESRILTITPDFDALPQMVFISIRYREGPQGDPGVMLRADIEKPDNRSWLELARIDLQPGVSAIQDAEDIDNPHGNELDLRYAPPAGSLGIVEQQMPAETIQHLIQVMRRTRRDFAALDQRFPVTSTDDVRYATLTVETLARTGCVRPGQLPSALTATASVEQDVGQELDEKYGHVLHTKPEFQTYQSAVKDLLNALQQDEELGVLTRQDAVAEAARELSEITIQTPIADTSATQPIVHTRRDEVVTALDASRSKARGGRTIARYHWSWVGDE